MVIETVGFFAQANGQVYEEFRHVAPGAPPLVELEERSEGDPNPCSPKVETTTPS